jgi:hypothetical protein
MERSVKTTEKKEGIARDRARWLGYPPDRPAVNSPYQKRCMDAVFTFPVNSSSLANESGSLVPRNHPTWNSTDFEGTS